MTVRNWYGGKGGEQAHERALFCEPVLFRSITSDDPYTKIYKIYVKCDFCTHHIRD